MNEVRGIPYCTVCAHPQLAEAPGVESEARAARSAAAPLRIEVLRSRSIEKVESFHTLSCALWYII